MWNVAGGEVRGLPAAGPRRRDRRQPHQPRAHHAAEGPVQPDESRGGAALDRERRGARAQLRPDRLYGRAAPSRRPGCGPACASRCTEAGWGDVFDGVRALWTDGRLHAAGLLPQARRRNVRAGDRRSPRCAQGAPTAAPPGRTAARSARWRQRRRARGCAVEPSRPVGTRSRSCSISSNGTVPGSAAGTVSRRICPSAAPSRPRLMESACWNYPSPSNTRRWSSGGARSRATASSCRGATRREVRRRRCSTLGPAGRNVCRSGCPGRCAFRSVCQQEPPVCS